MLQNVVNADVIICMVPKTGGDGKRLYRFTPRRDVVDLPLWPGPDVVSLERAVLRIFFCSVMQEELFFISLCRLVQLNLAQEQQ